MLSRRICLQRSTKHGYCFTFATREIASSAGFWRRCDARCSSLIRCLIHRRNGCVETTMQPPSGLPQPFFSRFLQLPQLQQQDLHSVRREVVSMAIKPGVRACLLSQGFRTTAELAGCNPQQVAQGRVWPHADHQHVMFALIVLYSFALHAVAGINLLDAQEVLQQCLVGAASGNSGTATLLNTLFS